MQKNKPLNKQIIKDISIKYFLLLSFIGTSVSIYADRQTALIVHGYDGETTTWIISESPRINHSLDSLFIVSTSMEITYPIDDVWKLTFEKVEVETTDVNSTLSNDLSFNYNTDKLTISGINIGCMVRVFNIGGMMICSERLTTDTWTFQLSNLPPGVYIINVDGKSFKISKK